MKIENVRLNTNTAVSNNLSSNNNTSFENVLNGELEKNRIQFSKHANRRLVSRQIDISDEQYKRIETGINLARSKGITDTLILVDNIALVVNTKNSVIVTAIKNENNKVFTNINGAVIV